MELDRLDYKILAQVQRDNRLTADALSAMVNLSPTACQRRLRRLRENGIIEADQSIVSPTKIGRPFMMIVHVILERERADIVDRFKQRIRETPEVMSGFYVAGETDFILIVSARDMEDYEDFTRDFFYRNSDVRLFRSIAVMDRVKTSFALPLHLEEPEGNDRFVVPEPSPRLRRSG